MSDIEITRPDRKVVLTRNGRDLVLERVSRPIVFSKSGASGPPGADGVGIPAGGTTSQILEKASNTDYDSRWGYPWYMLVLSAKATDDPEVTISTGIVSTYTYTPLGTIYRFESNDELEDSFYQNFDGTTLSNRICTRGD